MQDKLLVGLTTYPGGFERQAILHKALRHFRSRHGANLPLLVVSDGPLADAGVYRHADFVLCRGGPSGLQQGELDSIKLLCAFARAQNFRYVLKFSGDIILGQPDWAYRALQLLQDRRKKIVSTHWFEHDSWVVGTKFLVAETEFLASVLPDRIAPHQCLERALTASISRQAELADVAYLINSATGEKHEAEAELRAWQWEHAHQLHKFVHLDDVASVPERLLERHLLCPLLRARRELSRFVARLY